MDRVLEIGGFAAGWCGRLFAQAGHEVVRIEPAAGVPAAGDPGWVSQTASDLYLHAGKKRLTPQPKEVVAALASRADVVILEAPGADAVTEWGYEEWSAPVKATITPFGRTGPKRNWRATPSTLLAMGGYTNLMGDEGREPLSLPGHYTEFQAANFTYTAINANRLAGKRNDIDVGMLEVLLALSQFTTVMWHCAGKIRSRHGSDFWSVVPTNLFRCLDGWIYVNIVPTFWDPFLAFLQRPELALDPRFATNGDRMEHRDALHAAISEAIADVPKATLRERANEARIPAGVVQTFDEVLADGHLAGREFWQSIAFGDRTLKTPNPPFRMDRTRWPDRELRAPVSEGGFDG